MKRFTAILLTGMMIFTLASCGKKAQDTPTEPTTETQAAEKVEMPTETEVVTEGGTSNRGCNRNTADRSAAGRTDCRTAGRGAEQFR